MSGKLAINGGPKIREKTFPKQLTIDTEEFDSIKNFLKSGKPLSNFRGNWQPEFWGGENVQAFEREFENLFDFKERSALAVNSCTSALQVACGAIGLRPGDEVIVTPWSMSCSATAPMVWGATPVFADIERDYFCLDPSSVEEKITERTKAIIVVDLFGQPFEVQRIMDLARRYNLVVIEDAAQSPGAGFLDHFTGGLADIGCFSFTQGKHMTCGEGGMIVSQDQELYMKCALIRNHAEAVMNGVEDVKDKEQGPWMNAGINWLSKNMSSLYGFNMRMTELQAMIMRQQLKKLFPYIMSRNQKVDMIEGVLLGIPPIYFAPIRENCTHSYYVQGFHYDQEAAEGVHRDRFIAAVNAELCGEEGRPDRPMLGCGYIKPLYRFPLFNLRDDITPLPIVEKLWKNDFFLSMYHNLPLTKDDVQSIGGAFHKVWENRDELKSPNLIIKSEE